MKIPIEVARGLIHLFDSVKAGAPTSVVVDTNGTGSWHLRLTINERIVVSTSYTDITAFLGGALDKEFRSQENGK